MPGRDLPDGRLVRVPLGYLSLAVLRQGTEVYALADRCAHLGGPLHQGQLVSEGVDLCVACPWHGSTFRVVDGTVVHGPATARQPPSTPGSPNQASSRSGREPDPPPANVSAARAASGTAALHR